MQSKLFLLILTAILFTLSAQLEVLTHKQFIRFMKSLIPKRPKINDFFDYQDMRIHNSLGGFFLQTTSEYLNLAKLVYYYDDASVSSGSVGSYVFQSSSNLQTEIMRNLKLWSMGNGRFLGIAYENYFKAGSTGLGICIYKSLKTDTRGNVLPEEQQRIYNQLTQDPSRWTPQCLYLMEGNQIYDLYFNQVKISARVFADWDSTTNQIRQKVYLALGE